MKPTKKSQAMVCLLISFLSFPVLAQSQVGEAPALGTNRITQSQITNNDLSLQFLRKKGREIFSTPFNTLDGFGDGPVDPNDPTSPGGRPTLQNNGKFLRVNGLDSQACVECHGVLSNDAIPPRFGVGGVGGVGANAMGGATEIDVDDEAGFNYAFYNGRFINPPFVFGSGGVELVGKEMTKDLQALKAEAISVPGKVVQLNTHGVNFGSIVYNWGTGLNTSNVQGIDEDLVVRPFGRKGEFATTRAFDVEAMAFHFGMQPVEEVGENVDADGDGVVNEILVGELSAMHIFNATAERPIQKGQAEYTGYGLFVSTGCADCHVPNINVGTKYLTLSFPEVEEDPDANVYYTLDLTRSPTSFKANFNGGISVPMFSDLKRHDMGPELAESAGTPLDPLFITARLWGVADTGPWMHDGRATTLSEAIEMHGGEAAQASTNFQNLSNTNKIALLDYLRSLRTPISVGTDLDATGAEQ